MCNSTYADNCSSRVFVWVPFDNLFWGPFLCLIIVFRISNITHNNNNRVVLVGIAMLNLCVWVQQKRASTVLFFPSSSSLKCNVEKCAHALFYLFLLFHHYMFLSMKCCCCYYCHGCGCSLVFIGTYSEWKAIRNKTVWLALLFLFTQLTEPYLYCSCKIDMAYLSM